MKTFTAIVLLSLVACTPYRAAPTPGAIGFDDEASTTGWLFESTGGKGANAKWQPRADEKAVSKPQVMSMTAPNHSDEDRFNLCWSRAHTFHEGRIAVCVRADTGTLDQGGGPMWRVQDADNYYVCRWNPLESNYRVYVVSKGVRRQLATALVSGRAGDWHRLEVEHVGDKITCWFDGKRMLDAVDTTIPGSGGVGLWTKADACTSFDDLSLRAASR